jgi:hypothetical protein
MTYVGKAGKLVLPTTSCVRVCLSMIFVMNKVALAHFFGVFPALHIHYMPFLSADSYRISLSIKELV